MAFVIGNPNGGLAGAMGRGVAQGSRNSLDTMKMIAQMQMQSAQQQASMIQQGLGQLGRGVEGMVSSIGEAKKEKKKLDEWANQLGYYDWDSIEKEAETRGMPARMLATQIAEETANEKYARRQEQTRVASLADWEYKQSRADQILRDRWKEQQQTRQASDAAARYEKRNKEIVERTGKPLSAWQQEADVLGRPVETLVTDAAQRASRSTTGRYTSQDVRQLKMKYDELSQRRRSINDNLTATPEQKAAAFATIDPHLQSVEAELAEAEQYVEAKQLKEQQEQENRALTLQLKQKALDREPATAAEKDVTHRLPDGTMYYSVADRKEAMKKALEAIQGESQEKGKIDQKKLQDAYQTLLRANDLMYPVEREEQGVQTSVSPVTAPSVGQDRFEQQPSLGDMAMTGAKGIAEGAKALGSIFTGNWSGPRNSAPPIQNPANKSDAASATGYPPKPLNDAAVQAGVWYDNGDGTVCRDSGERDADGSIIFEIGLLPGQGR